MDLLRRDTAFSQPLNISEVLAHTRSALALTALMVIGAKVKFFHPLSPVPFTMQVFFVLMCGAMLGSGFGTLSQALYVALGVVGLPVFSGGIAGLAYLMGPTGGYILGFLVAPIAIGGYLSCTAKPSSKAQMLVAMGIGLAIIHGTGVLHLKMMTGMSFTTAIMADMPYIPVDILKALGVVALVPVLKKQ